MPLTSQTVSLVRLLHPDTIVAASRVFENSNVLPGRFGYTWRSRAGSTCRHRAMPHLNSITIVLLAVTATKAQDGSNRLENLQSLGNAGVLGKRMRGEHVSMRGADPANEAKKTKTSPITAGSCSILLSSGVQHKSKSEHIFATTPAISFFLISFPQRSFVERFTEQV
jgi:hypothetical protein